jgi:hypothetical protein
VKVTASLLNAFLQDQEDHGTRRAMANLLAKQAIEQLRDLGVRKAALHYWPAERRRPARPARRRARRHP